MHLGEERCRGGDHNSTTAHDILSPSMSKPNTEAGLAFAP
jgi:hypothetical protein